MSNKFVEDRQTDINVTTKITAQVAIRGTSNIDLKIDKLNNFLRQQAEIRLNTTLIDIDYKDSLRIGRGDMRHRQSDQILHLIPSFELQSMIRTLGTPELYLSEDTDANEYVYSSFTELGGVLHRKKVKAQDKDPEGALNHSARPTNGRNSAINAINRVHNAVEAVVHGVVGAVTQNKVANVIGEQVGKLQEKAENSSAVQTLKQGVNKGVRGWNNKRVSQLDERIRLAKDISKADYLDAISRLQEAFQANYPAIAEDFAGVAQTVAHADDKQSYTEGAATNIVNDSTKVLYHTVASDIVHDSMKMLLSHQQNVRANSETPRLNDEQLQALNHLILLHAKKEAFEEGKYIRSALRDTLSVTNIERLPEPGKINELQGKVGLGVTYDGAPHLSQLMAQSSDFRKIIKEESESAWRTSPGKVIDRSYNAIVRLSLHPDVETLVQRIQAQGKLTESLLADLQAGKGNRVELNNGQYSVIHDKEAGKNNMIPFEIEITRARTRSRDFDIPVPLVGVGARTNISSVLIASTIKIDYEHGKAEPTGFSVQRPLSADRNGKIPTPLKSAVDSARASNMDVSVYEP